MAFGGLAETAELAVKLSLQGNFISQINASKKALGGFDAALSKTEGRAYRAGQQIGTGIKNGARLAAAGVAFLGSQLYFGLNQLSELETQTAQTNAVLKSTGGIAGLTAKDVRNLAEKYENLNAVIDDKVIQSGENLLLTFTNIRKEAFEPALQAALDMSVALDQDLNTSVLQLGKALQDPVRGITALRRAGVNFSKDQEKVIKKLVKSGDLLGAQQLILQELAKEFGGSFKAQGDTAAGAVAGIGDAVEDLQKALATSLFPTIQRVLPQFRDFLASPQFVKGVEDLGRAIAGIFSEQNIAAGVDILRSVFQTAQQAAPVVAAAARTMASVVQTAVSVFRSLPPEIQQLAIGAFAINKLTGGLVTNIAGGLISSVLKQLVSGVVNVQGGVVTVVGATGGVPGVAPGGGPGIVGAVGKGVLAVTMVAVSAEAASAVAQAATSAIDPALQAAINAGQTPLANRDPRRFNQAGQVVQNILPPKVKDDIASTARNTERIEALKGYTATAAENAQKNVAATERAEAIASQKSQELKDALVAASVHNAESQNAATRAANQQAAFQVRDKVATSSGLVQAAVNQARAAITATTTAARFAGQQTAAAIRDKDLSVTTNVSVSTSVSIRDTLKKTAAYKTVYHVAS